MKFQPTQTIKTFAIRNKIYELEKYSRYIDNGEWEEHFKIHTPENAFGMFDVIHLTDENKTHSLWRKHSESVLKRCEKELIQAYKNNTTQGATQQ